MARLQRLLLLATVLVVTLGLGGQQEPKPAPPNEPKAPPVTTYDGTWSAETSQGKIFSVRIVDGILASMTFGYKIPGACVPVRAGSNSVILDTLENSFDVSWTKPELAPKIKEGKLRIQDRELPSGIFLKQVWYVVDIAFESPESATATITFEPPQPCPKYTATWKARR